MNRVRYPTPPNPDDEGFTGRRGHSSMNDDDHARRRRQLLEDLKVLSSMGLNKVLHLPQLVCIGSQSAGKSSLIETLCRITLPRATGTCTRCPIECRSKYIDQPWRGRVFLRFESESGGSADVREVPFGDEMTDPTAMEKRIAQAQLAVLCPSDDPNRFLAIDPSKFKASQAFTASSVVVDISGHQQADLNFVDLPGLIANVGDGGERRHIDLVQQMVRGYISKPNTIILLVVSCHTDYETQGAGILAAEFDREGKRTVGVLTKPDRAESNEDAAQWIEMITNRANRLVNGWFSVKQPDSRQRKDKLTWEEARELEAEFFETQDPWASIPPEYRGHLGSANLAYQLGNILAAALESRFVELRIEIDRIVRETSSKLRQFPDPSPQEPLELIQDILAEFYKDIRIQMVEGDPSAEDAGVIQTLRRQGCAFREQLQTVVPVFQPRRSNNVIAAPDTNFVHQCERWLIDSPLGTRYTVDDVETRCQG
ncbi:hypothetical protein FRC08_006660 [Ceratobasidium sp. 394]|nr:hypothetical protein FRC08_006660 [Ceratobasidium sp. 394]